MAISGIAETHGVVFKWRSQFRRSFEMASSMKCGGFGRHGLSTELNDVGKP